MYVHEFLTSLDEAIAATPWWRPGAIALEMHAPGGRLLGERGRHVDRPGERPTYGFTRRQCVRLRREILDAARADASAPGVEVDGGYTGDVQ